MFARGLHGERAPAESQGKQLEAPTIQMPVQQRRGPGAIIPRDVSPSSKTVTLERKLLVAGAVNRGVEGEALGGSSENGAARLRLGIRADIQPNTLNS